jgi:hypothetical protein
MLQRAFAIRPCAPQPTAAPALAKRYFTSTPTSLAQKDTMDKDSIKTTSNEYSKSGSDDDAAHSGAAFDASNTSPEGENKAAEKEGGGNSLDVSPSNPEVSKGRGAQEGGPSNSPRDKSSGGGSPQKGGTEKKANS